MRLSTFKTDSDLSTAIEQIDIEDWMSHLGVDYRVTVGSSGAQVNIKECPRCGGSRWKVFMNAETGFGNCFHGSCVDEPGFNLFTFTRHQIRGTNGETAKQLVDFAKTQGWRPKAERVRRVIKRPDALDLPAAERLHMGSNVPYLENRGVDGRIAERFDLRMCQQGGYDYKDHEGNDRTQNYSGRIIIPIRDIDGTIVTFQGRDVTGEADKKYLFPPGLPGTGRYLYNAHRAKGKKHLIMGEGAFDVIAIDMAFEGHDEIGAIGSFGKAFTGGEKDAEDQLKQLAALKQAGATSLTFMWDSEPATIRSACNAVEVIRRIIPKVRIAVLPSGCDPNEVSAVQVRAAYVNSIEASRANIFKLRVNIGK